MRRAGEGVDGERSFPYKVIHQTSSSVLNISIFEHLIHSACSAPLGMESGEIEDYQITASHALYNSAHYQAKNARLNLGSPGGAWCSEGISEEHDQYIQIDLLKNTKITGIAIQPRQKSTEYVEKFQVLYKRDGEGETFRRYNESGSWKVRNLRKLIIKNQSSITVQYSKKYLIII